MRMTGEAGRSLTLSWPGSAWSRGHSLLVDSDVTVIYQISARDQRDFVFFIPLSVGDQDLPHVIRGSLLTPRVHTADCTSIGSAVDATPARVSVVTWSLVVSGGL